MSRRAGMAEVASGVLHNVGNVMNSVNVGASVTRDAVKALPVEGVARAVRPDRPECGISSRNISQRMPPAASCREYLRKLGEHAGRGEAGRSSTRSISS